MKSLWSAAAKVRSILRLGPSRTHLNRARDTIRQSKLFDPVWYVDHYPDVASARCDALTHFLRHGAAEGRNPSERFDLRWYIRRNPDVARSGVNPLLHYLEYGRAEGRSIRSVASHGSDDPDDGPLESTAGTARAPKLRVPPYPSDFKPTWQARSVTWSDLPEELDRRSRGQCSESKEAALSATEWIKGCFSSELPDAADVARISWFRATQRDYACDHESEEDRHQCSDLHEDDLTFQASQRSLIDHGLGLELIVDGWFAGFDRLVLRMRAPPRPSSRIRGFQFDTSGAILCCADAFTVAGDLQFLRLNLVHELCPVLLTWMDDNDNLAGCTVVPFPSLFRGGLHHSELLTVASTSGGLDAMETYATALAKDLIWPRAPQDGFAINTFQVDLSGANGTEPVFNSATIAALATQFGIRLQAVPANGHETMPLAHRFDNVCIGPRVVTRMGKAGVLTVPADGFPSLRAMVTRRAGQPLGTGSFCVANAATRQPEHFVCMPPVSPEISKIQHPALPAVRPVCRPEADAVWPMFGPPVMIRFRDGKAWSVDTLMPVSLDVPMPLPAGRTGDDGHRSPMASAIISNSSGSSNLPLLLASLERQTANDLELLLLDGPQPGDPGQHHGTLLPVEVSAPSENIGQCLNQAAAIAKGDYLIFIDTAVSLPDPRTVHLLLALANQPGIASVACHLVYEDAVDCQLSVKSAGLIAQVEGTSIPEGIVSRVELSRLFPAAVHSVVANDPWLCVIPRKVWSDLGGFSESASTASLIQMDFASRARAQGLASICTGLVIAAVSEDVAETDLSAEGADRDFAVKENDFENKVTSYLGLGR